MIGALRIVAAFHLGLTPVATVSFAVFMGLGYPWLKAQREDLPFGFIFFGGYLACVAAEIGIHLLATLPGASPRFSHLAAVAIYAIYILKIPLLALACIPLRTWISMFRATGLLCVYVCIPGMAAYYLREPSESLWTASSASVGRFMQTASFDSVRTVLHYALPDVAANAAAFTVYTPRFSIEIGPGCSGMEGLGLIFAFTSFWLWYLRKECRFPQALLLIPCGLVCIWLLNIVRLSALIFIGDAISPEVASIGFHSQFGWIAFTVVALAFSMATQRLSWVRKTSPAAAGTGCEALESVAHGAAERVESPAIRAYLVPFLAILAAAFVSKAASGYFEWLYPLRFVVAVIALCYFRSELKKLNWRFGWFGPTAGAAVFLMWIAPSWIAHQHTASPLGAELAALSPPTRWAWIALRVAAAVVTVPIAEELAFRGYLARRLISREFDSVSFSSLTVLSICLSSAVFGLEHMKNLMDWQHLMLGTVAGLAFAVALRWRGRIGDAVVAHAVSNLLLAVWVLGLGDWAQW